VLYAQGTYKLTDKLSVTGGFRYTWDETRSISQSTPYTFPATGMMQQCNDTLRYRNAEGTGPLIVDNKAQCHQDFKTRSEAPTWVIDLEYKPVEDVMVYAKWSRGYRQGSLNTNVIGYETSDPEKVDAYEIGAKASFNGA